MLLDFTSCSYLGLRHSADQLGCWSAIADSRPAALKETPLAKWLGRAIARLQGEEDGVVGPSSLTLAMDVLGPALGGDMASPWRVLVDAGCYPVLLWAATQGGPTLSITHYRPQALAQALTDLAPGVRPLLAVDGFCIGCGRAAPLTAYATLLASRRGRLLVDDTQALGVLGPGGAGTPAHGAPPGIVLRLASLAKAFNAPLAVLSGSQRDIAAFRDASASRIYCSPPSTPAVLAAARALRLNHSVGGHLRAALRAAVLAFRRACLACSVPLVPGLFPIQTVITATDAVELVAALAARGLSAFTSHGFHDRVARLRLIVTAAHRPTELQEASRLLASVLRRTRSMEPAHASIV
jgi:8-amino-7-oxononanoate synthase